MYRLIWICTKMNILLLLFIGFFNSIMSKVTGYFIVCLVEEGALGATADIITDLVSYIGEPLTFSTVPCMCTITGSQERFESKGVRD
jgi:hypothetical protein